VVDPRPLLAVLETRTLIGHNLAFDLAHLRQEYGMSASEVRDTMLLSRLLTAGETRAGKGFHGLQALARRVLGVHVPKTLQRSDWTGELTRAQLEYAARDAAVLLLLEEKLQERIDAAGLRRAAELEARCLPAMVWLMTSGVPVDGSRWEMLAAAAE